MKLKYTFVINEVAGQKVAVPIDCENGEQSIIKTNDAGAYILDLLKNDITTREIIDNIKTDFEVENPETLEKWVDTFIEKLKSANVLIDE